LRGGSWDNNTVLLRASFRGNYSPDNTNFYIGCRAARSP
jgi:formylglycine-generating enzyme required for sulfatase activity